MEKEIKIREIQKSDCLELVELFDKVWPETAGTKSGKTEWIISSGKYLGYCAISDNKIIGSRLAFYTNLFFQNRKIKCVQFANSCVDSNFRRYGIFSKMNKTFVESYFNQSNELIYNISVFASRLAYEKLGWQYIEGLCKLTNIANPISVILKTKLNIKKLAGVTKYEVAPIPDLTDLDRSLLDIRENYFRKSENLHTYYDIDFLNWRIQSNTGITLFSVPDVGVIFYKTGYKNKLKIITIGEIMLYDYKNENMKNIINLLKKNFAPDILEIIISEKHPLYKFYRKLHFIWNPFKKYLNLGVKVETNEMRTICYNPNNWAIATIDIDTF